MRRYHLYKLFFKIFLSYTNLNPLSLHIFVLSRILFTLRIVRNVVMHTIYSFTSLHTEVFLNDLWLSEIFITKISQASFVNVILFSKNCEFVLNTQQIIMVSLFFCTSHFNHVNLFIIKLLECS